MRVLALVWMVCVGAGCASEVAGQVVFVEFKDAKALKKHRKYISEFKGVTGLIGEPHSGITIAPNGGIQFFSGTKSNELWVGDPARPGTPPYKVASGVKKKGGKGALLELTGNQIAKISWVDRFQTLEGIANEYRIRDRQVGKLEEARDEFDKSSSDWMAAHGRLAAKIEELRSWLNNVGYRTAAIKLGKELDKQRKRVAAEASMERQKKAIASISPVPNPAALDEVAQAVSGGTLKFQVMESTHLRIIYNAEIPDGEVQGALELGETLIESFRREFVDPYLDADFPDHIPDLIFQEVCMGPSIPIEHEKFYEQYYKGNWGQGERRTGRLASAGTQLTRGKAPWYLSYWKTKGERDLQGVVAHMLGHTLADLHFNKGRRVDVQPWLVEAVGYYLSFSYLGRNAVTCFQFSQGGYANKKKDEGEKTVELGIRGLFNNTALVNGPPLDRLAMKRLPEIANPDFAKAWSVFDWVAQELGKDGQIWLRKTCRAAVNEKKFMQTWRKDSEELFDVEPGTDVFRVIEDRWRKYASTEQARTSW